MQRLAMIGRDYPDLGSVSLQSLDKSIGCISAGSDTNSPSFAYKGHKDCPNEDGLVILKDGDNWLLAVTDGHLGHESSHALLDGLARLAKIPARLGPLSLALSAGDWLEDSAGGTTLLVACCNGASGNVFGLSFGDSSLITLGPGGAKVKNQLNETYLRGGEPISVEDGSPFQFQLKAGETLLLYTDGVNECCYRDPFRSVKLGHLEELYLQHREKPADFTRALMDLALAGVDGNPGGQDNIVIIAYPF
jgi:hypothetical protein